MSMSMILIFVLVLYSVILMMSTMMLLLLLLLVMMMKMKVMLQWDFCELQDCDDRKSGVILSDLQTEHLIGRFLESVFVLDRESAPDYRNSTKRSKKEGIGCAQGESAFFQT